RAIVISPPPDVPLPPLPVLSPSSPHAAASRPRASSGTNTTRHSRMRPPPVVAPLPQGDSLLYTFDKFGESRIPGRTVVPRRGHMSETPNDRNRIDGNGAAGSDAVTYRTRLAPVGL